LYKDIFSHQKKLKTLGSLARFYDRSGTRWLVRNSGVLNAFGKLKYMENILHVGLKPSLRSQPSEILSDIKEPKFKIGYFAGCAINTFFSEISRAMVLYLQYGGCQVDVPVIQCCGGPHWNADDMGKPNGQSDKIWKHLSKKIVIL